MKNNWKYIIFGAIIALILAGLVFVFSTKAGATQVSDNCDHSCSTVEWTEQVCPEGYFEHGDNCRKLVFTPSPHFIYTDKVEGETFNVTYEKSQDPNKCHRPSTNELKDEYDMSNGQAVAFTQDNPEFLDSIDVAPEGYYLEDGICYPNPVDVCNNIEGVQEETPEGYTNDEGYCYIPEEPKDYCDTLEGVQAEDEDCPREEPTPTPGNPGNPPTFAGSTTEAPVCSNGNTSQVVANAHVVREGSQATVNFFITEGDSANIYWRVVGASDWQNAVSNVKPNSDNFVSFTIDNLDPNLGYDFGIQQKSGCGGGLITAVIVDGPEAQTFRVNYYLF